MLTADQATGSHLDASSPAELAGLIDSCRNCWEAAREQLYDGRIFAWLRATGHEDLAESWQAIDSEWRFQEHDKDAGVEALIGILSPGTRRPSLHVEPDSVQVYGIHAGQCKQVTVTVSNPGRGHLYGTTEMHPPTSSITSEPVSISASGMLGKTQVVKINMHAERELAASSTLRFLSSGGTRDIYVGYRCLFPYMLLFPFLGMAAAFLPYVFLLGPAARRLAYVRNLAFGAFVGPVISLCAFLAVLTGIAFSLYARRLRDPRWWRFLFPSVMGGITAGVLILMLADGTLDTVSKASDQMGYFVGWLSIVGLVLLALAALNRRFMSVSPRLYVFFVAGCASSLVTGSAILLFRAYHYIPPSASVVEKGVVSLNTVLVPEVVMLFIGFGIGQLALEGYDYQFLDRSTAITHAGFIAIALVVLLVVGILTIGHLSGARSSAGPDSDPVRERAETVALRAGPPTARAPAPGAARAVRDSRARSEDVA